MNRAYLLAALALASVAAVAQGPAKVWDEIEGEWVSLSEFTRRYASLGPGALRLSQLGPVASPSTDGLRVLPDNKPMHKVDPYITIPKGPGRYRGWEYDFHGNGVTP